MKYSEITKQHIGQWAIVRSPVGPDIVRITNVSDTNIVYGRGRRYLKAYVITIIENQTLAFERYNKIKEAWFIAEQKRINAYEEFDKTIKAILKGDKNDQLKLGSSP